VSEARDPVFLDELPWTTVRERLRQKRDRIVILLGSTENHGPHAPLGTDTLIARGVGERLARRLDALATPVLPFGHAPQHLAFPGSISLGNRTLATVLVEIAEGLAGYGFGSFVFLSGHGGNKTAIDLAISELIERTPRLSLVHARMLPIQTGAEFRHRIQADWPVPLSDPWGAHGGEQETSAVLAVRPELVDLDAAPPIPDVSDYLRSTRDPAVTRARPDLVAVAPHGTWGDPRGAHADQGRRFLDEMADVLAERTLPLLPHRPPRRNEP
jgi:creatinine amidohydrolase